MWRTILPLPLTSTSEHSVELAWGAGGEEGGWDTDLLIDGLTGGEWYGDEDLLLEAGVDWGGEADPMLSWDGEDGLVSDLEGLGVEGG